MEKKKLFIWAFFMLFCVFFVSVSCSSDNERINVPKITETQEETIIGFDQLKESTYPTIMQLAEKSFNYNTSTTRTMQADNDTLQMLCLHLSDAAKIFLEQNDLDYSEYYEVEDSEYRMAYLCLLLIEYNNLYSKNITRASLGDCLIRASGVGMLAAEQVSKRAVMKALIKVGLKRAIPGIGWGLFLGEGAACLAGY